MFRSVAEAFFVRYEPQGLGFRVALVEILCVGFARASLADATIGSSSALLESTCTLSSP